MAATKSFQVVMQIPPGPLDELQLHDGIGGQPLETNFAADRYPTALVPQSGDIAGTVASKTSATVPGNQLAQGWSSY